MYAYSYPPVRVSRDSLVTGIIPGSSRDAHTYTYPYPLRQSIPGFPSNWDHPGMHMYTYSYPPPVRVSRDSLVTVTILGSSRDAHTYTYPYPPVRVSRDSLVTVTIPGSSRDAHVHILLPPCQSIPGFPSNCDYPGIIPGCTHIHIPLPPCQSIPGFSSNCAYPGIIPGCTCTHTPTPTPLSEYPGIP